MTDSCNNFDIFHYYTNKTFYCDTDKWFLFTCCYSFEILQIYKVSTKFNCRYSLHNDLFPIADSCISFNFFCTFWKFQKKITSRNLLQTLFFPNVNFSLKIHLLILSVWHFSPLLIFHQWTNYIFFVILINDFFLDFVTI